MPNCYVIQAFVGDNMKQWRVYGVFFGGSVPSTGVVIPGNN